MDPTNNPNFPPILIEDGTAIITAANPTVQPDVQLGDIFLNPVFRKAYRFSRADVVRVVRLFIEAIEVAFFLCNAYLGSYGLAKIFDVVNQIIPTAYVYNSSYWVFYQDQHRQSVCVCNKFGIKCVHTKCDRHRINMDPLPENVENYFKIPISGKLYPFEISVSVTPVMANSLWAYEISIDMVIQELILNNTKFCVLKESPKIALSFESRYILTPENETLQNKAIFFSPHPITKHIYSSYFQNLDQFHIFVNGDQWDTQIPQTFTMVSVDMPKFTFSQDHVASSDNNSATLSYCHSEFSVEYEVNTTTVGQFSKFGISARGGSPRKAYSRTCKFLNHNRVPPDAVPAGNAETVRPIRRPEATYETKQADYDGKADNAGFSNSRYTRKPRPENGSSSLYTRGVPFSRPTHLLLEYIGYQLDASKAAPTSSGSRNMQPQTIINKNKDSINKHKQEHIFLGPDYEALFPSLPQPTASVANTPTDKNQKKVWNTTSTKNDKDGNSAEASNGIGVDGTDSGDGSTNAMVKLTKTANKEIVVNNDTWWYINNDVPPPSETKI